MQSRYHAIADVLIHRHKSSVDGSVVLKHETWTPHNVKSIYLDDTRCIVRFYDSTDAIDIDLTKTVRGSKEVQSDNALDKRDDIFSILYATLNGVSANIKNIREFVIFVDPQKGEPSEQLEALGLSALKTKKSVFNCLDVICVKANELSMQKYSNLIKAVKQAYAKKLQTRYSSKQSIEMQYAKQELLIWSTDPPAAGAKTSTFLVQSAGTKIAKACSDLKALSLSGNKSWIRVLSFRAENRVNQICIQDFNIGNYPADSELREYISDYYWKPLCAEVLLNKLCPEVSSNVQSWIKALCNITSMTNTATTLFRNRAWLETLLSDKACKEFLQVCISKAYTPAKSILNSVSISDKSKKFFDIIKSLAPETGTEQDSVLFCDLVLTYFAFTTFLLIPYKNFQDQIVPKYISDRKKQFTDFKLPFNTAIPAETLAKIIPGVKSEARLKEVLALMYSSDILKYTTDLNLALSSAEFVLKGD